MANLNIRLNKNFQTQFNRMREKYGEEFEKLNGFSDEILSYTDFIDNFIDTETVADASIDGNANVGHKDIVTLLNEMPKPHQKLLAFNKIYYEINKKYGFKTANEWLENIWNNALYLHDANTATFKPYCIKPEECCTYLLDGKTIYASFKQIYDLLTEPEETDGEILFKRPRNLSVQDFINGQLGWTKVTCVSKKQTAERAWYVKGRNGYDIITTENHHFITPYGDIAAKNLTADNHLITKCQNNLTNSVYEYNGLPLTADMGWLIGMYLAEGYNQRGQLTICQFKEKNPKCWSKLIEVLEHFGIPYTEYQGKGIRLKNDGNNWERKILTIAQGKYAYEKCLCPDYIHFNYDFLHGLLGGIIDGDGTIRLGKEVLIRMASRTLINQIKNIGQHFNVYFSGNKPYIQSQKGPIQQRRIMYAASANMNQNKDWFLQIRSIKIQDEYLNYDYSPSSARDFVRSDGTVPVKNSEEITEVDNTVFDLSTQTHHFICNGIQVHNCYAYDLKDLAEKGLFFVDNFNAEPPRHLGTFVDFVKEFINYCSNRSSGACGLPNLIPYMYYFWDRDVKAGYYTKDPISYAKQHIQRFIYAVNQPCVRDGMQSAFTNTSIFDHPYLEALFGGAEFPDGAFMIDEIEGIMEFQWLFLETMSEIRSRNMMTFPVNTISLLKKNGKFVDEEFARKANRHNLKWADSNIFADSSVNSLSQCCRLKANVEDLGYFNSIGSTALRVGSVKVSTINLARLAIITDNEKDYLKKLQEITELNLKSLDCIRGIIKRNIEKGLLPNYGDGLIDLKTQYCTIGFIGVYETMKSFGYVSVDEFGNTYYKPEAYKFGEKIFKVLHNVKDTFALDKDYLISIEQIPGEAAAEKLQRADELLYPEKVVKDLPLYGNQFIPLGIKATLQERIKIAATFDKYCNGGNILHVNIEAPFNSEESAWKMLNYITDVGVTYFAFTTKIQACKHNHAFFGKTCPICGEGVATEYSRIVGFYVPIRTYSKARKEEWKMREWENTNVQ